jgi:hypothetical protein
MYYGDRPDTFREVADFYGERKGSKFQNLHYCYQQHRDVFAGYDAVLVIDDDVLIDATDITKLFELRRELDLWLLQPAFRLGGKISWDITRVRPTAKLRYTNFVEVTCPLFRRDKLDDFMAVYDPDLSSYGVDWWFLKTIGGHDDRRVAVVDEVTCVNPYDRTKGGAREIDRLQPKVERQRVWSDVSARHGLEEQREQRELGRVERSLGGAVAGVLGYFIDWLSQRARGLAARFVRATGLAFANGSTSRRT